MPLILIVIGVVLIIYNYHAIKKENISLNEENISINNSTFKHVLKDNKDGLNEYKLEIGLLRKDIAESLTELQEEILEIKTKINMTSEFEEQYENKESEEETIELNQNDLNENIHSEEDSDKLEEISEREFLISQDINSGVISEINFTKEDVNIESGKTKSIKELLKDGLTDEEICHELSISKGEVLLVKGLFKN